MVINSHDRGVVLTDDGKDLLEANRRERDADGEWRALHADICHPRGLEHDSELFAAYLEVERRLRTRRRHRTAGAGGRLGAALSRHLSKPRVPLFEQLPVGLVSRSLRHE